VLIYVLTIQKAGCGLTGVALRSSVKCQLTEPPWSIPLEEWLQRSRDFRQRPSGVSLERPVR
jgi:hypothetical protein